MATGLFLSLFLSSNAQIVQKQCIGTMDTVMAWDTITHKDVIDEIVITPLVVLEKQVLFAKFKQVDDVQGIVICEGLYDHDSVIIEGTNNRYFHYLSKRFPFVRLTQSEINLLK